MAKTREICERARENAAGTDAPEEAAASRPSVRGIPIRYARVLDEIDAERPAVQLCRGFLASGRPLLVLAGGVGVGKSVAAAWACANFQAGTETVEWRRGDPYAELETGTAEISRPGKSKFLLAYKLIQAGTFDKEFWKEVETPGLLVLDELGGEPQDAKGMGLANLTSLLTHRHAHDLKTIITTNATWDLFRRTYCVGPGLRTLDRINEYPGEVFREISGDSMRGQEAKQLVAAYVASERE